MATPPEDPAPRWDEEDFARRPGAIVFPAAALPNARGVSMGDRPELPKPGSVASSSGRATLPGLSVAPSHADVNAFAKDEEDESKEPIFISPELEASLPATSAPLIAAEEKEEGFFSADELAAKKQGEVA